MSSSTSTRQILGAITAGVFILSVFFYLLDLLIGPQSRVPTEHSGASFHPAWVPSVDQQRDCESREGTVWRDNECLDFDYDPRF